MSNKRSEKVAATNATNTRSSTNTTNVANAINTANVTKVSAFSWKDDSWVKPYLGRYKKTLCLAIFFSLGSLILVCHAVIM